MDHVIKHNPKMFTRIELQKLKNLDLETREIVGHINLTWIDIEYFRYIFYRNHSDLSNEKEVNMLFSALTVQGATFYIYLSIILKLFEKLGRSHRSVKKLLKLNEKWLRQIQIVRNVIIIHKEKPNFRKAKSEGSSTDPKYMFEFHLVADFEGKEEIYILRPLLDVWKFERLLININQLLQSESNKIRMQTKP